MTKAEAATILADAKKALEEAKARIAEAREQERAAREASKEREQEERAEARAEATATATEKAKAWLKLKPTDEAYLPTLTEAIEGLSALRKTFVNGHGKGRRKSEGPNLVQRRMLVWLLDNPKGGNRQALYEVGTQRTGRNAGLSGAYLGNNDEETRDPSSLWGRGLVEAVEVNGERHFKLTAEGKVEARKAKAEMES